MGRSRREAISQLHEMKIKYRNFDNDIYYLKVFVSFENHVKRKFRLDIMIVLINKDSNLKKKKKKNLRK